MSIELFADTIGMCLYEAGRPDLAEIALCFEEEGWFYVEPADELDPEEEAIVARAERLARIAVRDSGVRR